MKRSWKLSLTVGVIVLGSAVTGAALATTEVTIHPITLCVGKPGAHVNAPDSDGQCAKSQTAIEVASGDDARALSDRLNNAEDAIASDELALQNQSKSLGAVQAKLDALAAIHTAHLRLTLAFLNPDAPEQFTWQVTGTNLKPGTTVKVDICPQNDGVCDRLLNEYVVDSDGRVSVSDGGLYCDAKGYGLRAFGIDIFGNAVASGIADLDGC
ncbi:hypothetical protein [Nocardioides terrisoli]|uniref:hypothetical protein n=1 Tax=Nocardioides terrisoli TaxID=3388267 RepID=UPI00287BBA20|nr:hypothetical protein [Nocardioides marmorisolisilvae]